MSRRSDIKNEKSLGLGALTPRGRAVLRAFVQARRLARGLVMSCGLLPEVSESCSDRLFQIVQEISRRHLDGRRHARALRKSLRRALPSAEAFDQVDRHLTALQFAETTAAYVFGLSVGLAMGAFPAHSDQGRDVA